MESILNITNGDIAVSIMQQANIPGDFLPWRDVLHDGPVPENLSLAELSRVRAEFLASLNWGDIAELNSNFTARDHRLASYKQYSKVILWFEHDLYDQLQILQILDWFSGKTDISLQMVCTEQYLGRATVEQIRTLQNQISPVTHEQRLLAKKAWAAFTAPSPENWSALLNENISALLFLKPAVIRLLEEYPSTENGLSRSAYTALKIIGQNEIKPRKLFSLCQQTEESIFMGDSSFWVILNQLLQAPEPLISLYSGNSLNLPAKPEDILSITDTGKAVLNAEKNWLDITNIEKWIGGVKLTRNNIWLWDKNSQQLKQTV